MKKIPLTKGAVALVDDADHQLVSGHSWQLCGGYARTSWRVQGKTSDTYMHRLIMGLEWGDMNQVDHINRNRLDNRRANLRLCTETENHRNTGKRSHNTSGYLGVTWCKMTQRWRAQIHHQRKNIHIGRYDDPVEAAAAYDRTAKDLHGEFATVNFPALEPSP